MTNPETARRILLAEDNPHDQFLLEESFAAENLNVQIDSVSDGDQLIERLRAAAGSYSVIVLDAHLPKRSAEEVLAVLQAEQGQLPVPVVVLTSLLPEAQKIRFQELGVRAILTKPLDLDEYLVLARTIHGMSATV